MIFLLLLSSIIYLVETPCVYTPGNIFCEAELFPHFKKTFLIFCGYQCPKKCFMLLPNIYLYYLYVLIKMNLLTSTTYFKKSSKCMYLTKTNNNSKSTKIVLTSAISTSWRFYVFGLFCSILLHSFTQYDLNVSSCFFNVSQSFLYEFIHLCHDFSFSSLTQPIEEIFCQTQ